jgi:hypothetical protein
MAQVDPEGPVEEGQAYPVEDQAEAHLAQGGEPRGRHHAQVHEEEGEDPVEGLHEEGLYPLHPRLPRKGPHRKAPQEEDHALARQDLPGRLLQVTPTPVGEEKGQDDARHL